MLTSCPAITSSSIAVPDHRDLHSFPTRRSSDLGPARFPRPAFRPGAGALAPAQSVPGSIRSEEHTSELQSLRHLVCRLLLEKKKIAHKSKQTCIQRMRAH